MKSPIDPIVARVRRYFGEQPKALAPACKELGIPYTTARDAIRPGHNPRLETISKLASAVPEDWRPAEEQGSAA